MNWIDIVILVVLTWFAVTGLSSGILRESVTLLGALVGLVVAGQLYSRLADDLGAFTDSEAWANIIAFAAIFGAVFLAGQIAAILLKRTAQLLMLGSVDHLAGLAFGLLKGFVLIEGALILFASYRVGFVTRGMNGSLLTPIFLDGLPILLHLLPGQFREAVERFQT